MANAMQIEELFKYIREQLYGCTGYVFIDRTFQQLREEISKHESFNPEAFKKWFIDRNVIYKGNPLAFISKCGLEDMRNCKFDDINLYELSNLTININSLLLAMDKAEIHTFKEDVTLINLIEQFIVKKGLMKLDQIVDWNHKAVEYLSYKNKTSKDFIYLFKNTKDMRAISIPFSELEKEANEINTEFENLMKEFNRPTAIGDESETKENEEESNNLNT